MQAREGGVKRKSFGARVIQNFLTVAFFVLIGIVIIYIKRHHGHLFGATTRCGRCRTRSTTPRRDRRLEVQPAVRVDRLLDRARRPRCCSRPSSSLDRRRRRKRRSRLPPLGTASTVAEDLAAAMSDAIDDLEAEPDARRAVIAAYARMEGVLARHGLRRPPSETPLEYLRRILLGLTARADAVKRLTSLFEQAKFSRHEIDGAMKLEAIGALREIRDDLQEAPA